MANETLAAEITEHIQLKGASTIAKLTPSTTDDNMAAEITEQNQLENKDDTFHKNKLRSTTTFLPVEIWIKRKKIVQPWDRPDNSPNRVSLAIVPKVRCRQRKGKKETEVGHRDRKRTTVLPQVSERDPKQTRSEETGRKD